MLEAAVKQQQEKEALEREKNIILEEQRKQKRLNEIEDAYTQIVEDDKDFDVLLLKAHEPSCTADKFKEIDQSVRIQELENERDQALQSTRIYRDLAEKLRTEKRILHNDMCKKLEVVREHYRNKIVEGSSRSGQMIKLAMKQTFH